MHLCIIISKIRTSYFHNKFFLVLKLNSFLEKKGVLRISNILYHLKST